MRYLTFFRQCQGLVRSTGKQFLLKDDKTVSVRYESKKSLRETFNLKRSDYKRPNLNEKKVVGTPEESGFGFSIILLSIPVISAGLGTWQVFRWRRKLEMIASMEERIASPPLPLPKDLSELKSMEYRKIKVRGKFDYTHEVMIGPRSLNREGVPKKGIIKKIRSDTNGFQLITPFKVTGQNLTLLVNRGWIPSYKQTNYRQIPESDEVEIIGVVRNHEPRPQFVNRNSGREGLYLYRDVHAMAEVLHTNHLFVDLHSVEAIDLTKTFPIPAQTKVILRNDHVSYIITWYGLAIATSYLFHRRIILKKDLL